MRDGKSARFWVESTLGAVAGLLGLLTLVWRDWIEAVFGVDPDHHNGSLEWIIVIGLLAVAVLLGFGARSEYHRLTITRSSPSI